MNRKYDLDYLQWLQKNARLYMVGLSLLTLIIVASWCLYFEPWQSDKTLAFWDNDSNQAVAEQQIPTESKQNENAEAITEKPEPLSSGEKQEEPVIQEQNSEPEETEPAEAETTKEPDPALAETTVDVTLLQIKLPGFTAPCSIEPVYRYGVGYDPVYDDYRFHDAACYQADGAGVNAVADGIVQHADLDSPWQIVLKCGDYLVRYQGLSSCKTASGEKVTGGQIIGTAGEYLIVQAAEL